MSQALAEAIVAAAKRDGVFTLLVGMPAPNGNGGAAPVGGGVDPTQYNQLNSAYEQTKAAHSAAVAERDGFCAQLREMEARARHFEAAAAGQGGAAAGVPGAAPVQPVAIAAFEGLGIEVLGLDEKMTKSLAKTRGWDSLGKLRAALLEGKLKTEAKLTKDDIIGIGEKLLGKVPPSGVPVSAASAPTSNTSGASDVPTGHKDRPWLERLNAARRKEQKKRQIEAKLDQLRKGTFVGADGKPLSPAVAAKVAETESKVLEVTNAQMTALLWSGGFDFDPNRGFGSVDEALTKAGLVALVEAAPVQEPQPGAQAQPPAPPPAPPQPQPQAAPPPPAPPPPPQPPQAPPQGYAPAPQMPQGYPPQPQYAPPPPPAPGYGYPPQQGYPAPPPPPGYGYPPQGYAPPPPPPGAPQGYGQPQPQYAPPPPPGPGQVPQMTQGFPG